MRRFSRIVRESPNAASRLAKATCLPRLSKAKTKVPSTLAICRSQEYGKRPTIQTMIESPTNSSFWRDVGGELDTGDENGSPFSRPGRTFRFSEKAAAAFPPNGHREARPTRRRRVPASPEAAVARKFQPPREATPDK